MRIGELSKATGASIRSLRYYEQKGLLTASRQVGSGYREYHALAVEQVNTIKLYLSLGLSTEQIAGFLHCVMKSKEAFCAEIMPVYEQKLAEIEEQLALLGAIRSNLIERIASIREEQKEGVKHVAHGIEPN
ncbi:MerR family transcriptional regulator [Cohnella thailandensis]|uniref:MerR family transcriptional regulator n=1 Tax=Cohnella thailandensis TaxID=557557 RepID=A0A841T4Y2_9BACL|nr:MerR family transcriptional regulator [Cohnella thailandensis]MBB6637725.1 MerR family transcriptional regulator [Cohnella thailandensis]MBP1974098.1 DNA-binding transcriptional MerR regulator [Cohnella thailandensis]